MPVPREPAFDDAAIWVRKGGRQLCVTTGRVDTGDRPSPEPQDESESAPGYRQKITGFTERSRRNLARWVHSVRRDADAVFLTLTYHETNPHPREAKSHLDSFLEWLHDTFPDTASVWKMEPQNRGTVHFHVLVFGTVFMPVEQLCTEWHMRTNEDSTEHLKAGLDIERGMNEDGKLAAYLSKYLAKTCGSQWNDPGRFWGIRRRENLPFAPWRKLCTVNRAEAQRIIFELLEDWGVDLPQYATVPQLTINTRGDPGKAFREFP